MTSQAGKGSLLKMADTSNTINKAQEWPKEWQDIQPYMFEPSKNNNTESLYDSDDDLTSTEKDESSIDESSIDESFEAINAWRLTTLEWCKCG